jgi:hypothetical protein
LAAVLTDWSGAEKPGPLGLMRALPKGAEPPRQGLRPRLGAGIEERRVKLAENQGAIIADVIRWNLAGLGLTPEQQLLVPDVLPRELRSLAAGC